MFPNINNAPNIDYTQLTTDHLLFDLVYNPPTTKFLTLGAKQGAIVQNGLDMLYKQADAALEIWLKTDYK